MTTLETKGRAAVLGGGIQGTLASLALAEAGFQVVLFEKRTALMTRASLQNEGKIHLGFIFANEPERETARLMVESATVFGPLLERWLPPFEWAELISRPFDYVVMPDSMASVEFLADHYAFTEEEFERCLRDPRRHYCGARPERIVRRLPTGYRGALAPDFEPVAMFRTAEIALEPVRVREHVLAAVACQGRVTTRLGCTIESVTKVGADFEVSYSDPSQGAATERYEVVVNCLWEDRLRIDHQVGLPIPANYSHRLKYIFTGHCERPEHADDRSLTLVLGPYGDYVRYASGNAYFSWYPVCLQGWTNEPTPPSSWQDHGDGLVDREFIEHIRQASVERFGAILPTIKGSGAMTPAAGIICAHGSKDIDHLDSELHGRARSGVTRVDGYLSVDTGKLTCAPLFASDVVRELVGEGPRL